MKLCRAKYEENTFFGTIDGEMVYPMAGDYWGDWAPVGAGIPLAEVTLLAPIDPRKVVCVGKNYVAHVMEFDALMPSEPLLFLKPSTAVIGPEEAVAYPSFATRVDYEGELGVIIGKDCRHVTAENYQDVILGYTCVNDVTERVIQLADGQWTRGKGFDTFCPVGPWIETELDVTDIQVETRLNGEVKQQSRTSHFIFNIGRVLEHITATMTLQAGDVVATGTPGNIGPMEVGDVVEVEVEGIGILRNTIAK